MGWSEAASAGSTDASALTSGSLASARQSTALRNAAITPIRVALSGGSLVVTAVDGLYLYNPLTDETVDLSAVSSLSASGLSTSTLHLIYLDTGGTPALVASTTAATKTSGVRHITGDTGRMLVAAGYVTTGPAWLSCCSLFNCIEATTVADGAAQSGIVADTNWKTPSTDMVISAIRHPDYAIQYKGQVMVYHDAAGPYVGAGIDVGATGTPTHSQYGASTAAGNSVVNATLEDESSPTGAFAYVTTRIRVLGDNSGSPDTIQIRGTISSYLRASYKY